MTTLLEDATSNDVRHACLVFDGDGEGFVDAAVPYLADGIARHERALFVGDGSADELHGALGALGDVEHLVAVGALEVLTVTDAYPADGRVDAVEQVGRYRRLVAAALADGYAGLRVAADATSLAATDDTRPRMVRYELAVDHLMAVAPMRAMCAYDHRVLAGATADMAAVHPHRVIDVGTDPGMSVHHAPDGIRLAGELDLGSCDVLAGVLDAVADVVEGDVTIDLSAVDFIDLRALYRLEALRARLADGGRHLEVRAGSPLVRRCCEIAGFDLLPARGTS